MRVFLLAIMVTLYGLYAASGVKAQEASDPTEFRDPQTGILLQSSDGDYIQAPVAEVPAEEQAEIDTARGDAGVRIQTLEGRADPAFERGLPSGVDLR